MKDISLYEKIPPQKNNYTLKIMPFHRSDALIPHWHEHIELLYFSHGECDFICDGKKYAVRPGDLIVVNSTEIHSYTTQSMLDYQCILIYPSFLADTGFDNLQIESHIRGDAVIDSCFLELTHEYNEQAPGADMMIKGIVYRLMAHLKRKHTYSIMTKRAHDARESRLRHLSTVMEYISTNYTEKITTEMLSKMCFISEAHFCRLFKKAVGKSATEYINEYRVQKAAILLKNTDESISGIASRVGFDDLNYFSRVFKRHLGLSPVKYREDGK